VIEVNAEHGEPRESSSKRSASYSTTATFIAAQLEAKILEATPQGPSDGTTHWSSYRLAKHLGVSHATVHRVWRQFGFNPIA
jgi:hypothetical protein